MRLFTYTSYINTAEGGRDNLRCHVRETAWEDGVSAVFIKALCRDSADGTDHSIHSEQGVVIQACAAAPVRRYMAIYRHSEYWCRPFFGQELTDMPDETQALVLELENGLFCVVLPVVNDTCKCVLKGCSPDTFSARVFSWYPCCYSCEGLAFVYAAAPRPAQAMTACVKSALHLLNSQTRHRTSRRYPALFDFLGWCTWDSMHIQVSQEGLLHKCREFQAKNIPVKWMILDDMWATVTDFYGEEHDHGKNMIELMHRSMLSHFEADPKRFPQGLAACIAKIADFGIQTGIWHPTTGYWKGFDPKGEGYRLLKDYLIRASNGYIVPDWQEHNAYLYYKTLHDFFRRCGAEFVKVDNQTMTRRYYKGLAPVGEVARAFHSGLEASVGEHFDNAMINCMGMGSEDIWNRSVSPISRCSDDFQPENRTWFAKHVLQCAYNSLFLGEFYWCDWDMWWTDDAQAGKNSLLRAISGGPIYISDPLDRSKRDILDPLILKNGRILRCDRPCTPTFDCVTVDPRAENRALKLQNTVGTHAVMAVLNITRDNGPAFAEISGHDIDGFSAEEYAVYEHYSREVRILRGKERFSVTLADNDDYRLYIFAPLDKGFAAIGRTDKLISPAAIRYVHREEIVLEEDGPCAWVKDGRLCTRHCAPSPEPPVPPCPAVG